MVVPTTKRLTLIWATLLTLTIGSFVIGGEQRAGLASNAALAIVGVAMLKVHFIGIHFMNLRAAPRALRVVFDGYVAATFLGLVVIDFLAR